MNSPAVKVQFSMVSFGLYSLGWVCNNPYVLKLIAGKRRIFYQEKVYADTSCCFYSVPFCHR